MTRKILIVLAVAAVTFATMTVLNRIVGGTILTVAFIAVLTAWVWRRSPGKPATARLVIPLYGGLMSLIVIATGVVIYVVRIYDYKDCLDRRDRSESNHDTQLLLYDTIDAATHTKHYTTDVLVPGEPSLRGSLQPAITTEYCRRYKP